LIQSTADLKKLEEAISNNLRTIEEAGKLDQASGRIENASQCVAEAVAMLATSLERVGLVRAAPQRPRPVSRTSAIEPDGSVSPITVPFSESAAEIDGIRPAEHSDNNSTKKAQTRKGKAA
jgi:hypothetical protein